HKLCARDNRGQMPFISVAIPTYRRRVNLHRAIESVFSQSFTDWELVVSDDERPSGETWDLLQTLALADSRIRPIKNRGPHGATFNHNHALRAARGNWIKILHDDDILKGNCLEVLAGIAQEYPDVLSISCACEVFIEGQLVRPFSRLDRPLLER